MAAKYKEYVDRMLQAEKDAFDTFKVLHDEYALKQDEMQERFNQEGAKIQEVLNEWENRLCKQSEKGGYSAFTPKLAEKFREEVRKHFPFIDYIGIKVSYAPAAAEEPFLLKKIRL